MVTVQMLSQNAVTHSPFDIQVPGEHQVVRPILGTGVDVEFFRMHIIQSTGLVPIAGFNRSMHSTSPWGQAMKGRT